MFIGWYINEVAEKKKSIIAVLKLKKHCKSTDFADAHAAHKDKEIVQLVFCLPTALLHIVLHLKESTYSQYTDTHLCQYMAAECVSVDHRADQSGGECPEQKDALLKWIIRPRQLFHEISICMKLWGMNTLTHFPRTMCLCGGCMHACVCVCKHDAGGRQQCKASSPVRQMCPKPARIYRNGSDRIRFMLHLNCSGGGSFFCFFIWRSLSRKDICASLCWSVILSFLWPYSCICAHKGVLV